MTHDVCIASPEQRMLGAKKEGSMELEEGFIQELRVTCDRQIDLLIESRAITRAVFEYAQGKRKLRMEPWQDTVINTLEPLLKKLDKEL